MNAFSLSVRYIRSRKLESALALTGIVLGVATLAGTLSLVSSYRDYFDAFSSSPQARQVTVRQATRTRSQSDEAAVLIGTTEIENIEFTAADAQEALAETSNVESFYQAQFRSFTTTASSSQSSGFGGPGGFGGGMMIAVTTQAGGAASAGGASGASGGAAASAGNASAGTAPTGGVPSGDTAPPEGDFPEGGPPEGGLSPEMQAQAAQEIDTTLEKPTMEEIPGAMVSGGFFSAYNLTARYGDVLSDAAAASSSNGAVIGSNVAKALYASVSDPADLVGMKLILNSQSYTIVGVLAYDEWNGSGRNVSFNDMVFVPTMELRFGSTRQSRYRELSFSVPSNGDPAQAAVELERFFDSKYGEGSVIAEANLDTFRSEVTKRERILSLMAILAAASALTAAINLFNLMTSRVMRRRRPIAIMRAIGAWNMRVFAQIMIEAAVIGVSGAVAGLALSPVVVDVLARMLENNSSGQSIPVSVNLPVLLAVGFGALFVSLLFAAIPARSGSRLVITDALRSE